MDLRHQIVKIIVVLILLFVATGIVLWWYGQSALPSPSSLTLPSPPAAAVATPGDLGSSLLEKSKNPLGDKLPEPTPPIPNPVENIYKNPFE